jgi:hypothetical protein
MRDCPICRRRVPTRELLRSNALSGIQCPGCKSLLELTNTTRLLLVLLPIVLGVVAGAWAGRHSVLVALVVTLVVGASTFLLLSCLIPRYEVSMPPIDRMREM